MRNAVRIARALGMLTPINGLSSAVPAWEYVFGEMRQPLPGTSRSSRRARSYPTSSGGAQISQQLTGGDQHRCRRVGGARQTRYGEHQRRLAALVGLLQVGTMFGEKP